MGKHLENLDEMALEENRKKKGSSSPKNEQAQQSETSFEVAEISIAEDENETKFDHGGNFDDESSSTPSLPSKDDVHQRMMKVVDAMNDSFKAIRGAEPSPELFDSVQVKAYGTMTALNAVAQVVITSPTRATLTCFDPDTCPGVRDAIRDMVGMNFNPMIEDGAVIVPIPRVSAETRKAIVKQLGKVAESTRQRVRRIRRAAQDVVKLGKDGKLGPGISEDDAFRASKEIDAVTEESIKALNDVLEKKQEDVMSV
jgi:ribosome recycling factor